MSKPEICPYCKNTIEPLDEHYKIIKPDTGKYIQVYCILTRIYAIEPKRIGE